MNKMAKGGILLLCLILVVGLVLTGCGKKEAALQQPELELVQYVRGSTVDLNEATLNTMAESGGEPAFKFGIMKAIYPTIWSTNKETVANQLFPAPYWRGDGVTTQYALLTSADQSAVDGVIFATKLSAAEQQVVNNAVEGFFALYADETAAAKPLEQNTAYGILLSRVSAAAADAWKADAAAWMVALDNYTSTNYDGKTYAQLTFVERATVNGIVFAKGHGTINPEYAFWRAMTKDSFRNGVASTMNHTLRDNITNTQYGKTYAELDCVQKPTVDAMVWAQLDDSGKAVVDAAVSGMLLSRPALGAALSAVGASAVTGFGAEVDAGMKMDLAFYKWLVYESFRNATAATFYPAQVAAKTAELYPGKTSLTICEQLVVNAAVWADELGPGERGYVTTSVGNMWAKVQAEMTNAVAIDQTTMAMTIKGGTGTETSVKKFKADVEGGMFIRQAFYRWLAKEKVTEMASAATMIQMSVGEFYIRITNPNKYGISIDTLRLRFTTTIGNVSVDCARQMVEDVWIPAGEEVVLKVVAPTKTLDVISWLVIAGKDSTTARSMAAQIWGKIQAGTIVWGVGAEAQVSHGDEVQDYSYTL